MEQLLQTFEKPFTDQNGDIYDVSVYGRSRPANTWQAWLVFTRRGDGRSYATGTETTQPSSETVVYWATGLEQTYLEGAFKRATSGRQPTSDAAVTNPPRSTLNERILRCFRKHGTTQLSTEVLFAELPDAHADIVRSLEDLEKRSRLLVRRTENGNDFVFLTEDGVRAADVAGVPRTQAAVEAEPAKPRH